MRPIADAVIGFNAVAPTVSYKPDGTELGESAVRVMTAIDKIDLTGLAAAAASAAFSISGTRHITWRAKPTVAVSAMVVILQVSAEDTPATDADWETIDTIDVAAGGLRHDIEVGGLWARFKVSTLTQIGQGAATVSCRAIRLGA